VAAIGAIAAAMLIRSIGAHHAPAPSVPRELAPEAA
jgi:hypothetical protein